MEPFKLTNYFDKLSKTEFPLKTKVDLDLHQHKTMTNEKGFEFITGETYVNFHFDFDGEFESKKELDYVIMKGFNIKLI